MSTRSATPFWKDDLLPGWDEEWLVIERERVRQLRMHSLEAHSRQLSRVGRHAEAIDAALTAIAAEPLRESARLALIEAHLAEGNVHEARRALESYSQLLVSEFGLESALWLSEFLNEAERHPVPRGRGTSVQSDGFHS